ncbi:MAG: S9 family peptidase [Candidatus Heimdallarchaeota archaeon]|nr:MAG: S9 family peptidase [Candidatus Heimdallarchaeota archaeon]
MDVLTMTSNIDLKPPIAKKIPKRFIYHGEELIDNYYWLREKDNLEVIDYLKAENKYTKTMMEHTEKLQDRLFEELKSRIKEDDVSAPVKAREYQYYFRMEKGKQYKKYFRKNIDEDLVEELLLDENELATDHDYFKIGSFKVSPNHEFLAYSVDVNGSEEFTVFIKDLKNNKILDDRITNTAYGYSFGIGLSSLEWTNDNKSFLYATLDETKRPYKLFRHEIGSDPKEDRLIYHEKDKAYFLYLTKSRDQEYFLMTLQSNVTTEVHFLPVKEPDGDFTIIHPRQPGMEYYIEHQKENFIIRTNDAAKNFRIMKTSVTNPKKENWTELISHRESVFLRDFEVFENFHVFHERENGLPRIRIINQKRNEDYCVDFPDLVYTCEKPLDTLVHPEFKSNLLRFTYTSLVTPNSVFDFNMDTRKRNLVKQDEILGGYDQANYHTERITAQAMDGQLVQISLVHKKNIHLDGRNPLLLYGYGSYGYSIDPEFLSYRISLLDRGFIFAIAHIRGGSELGRKWYEDGRLLHKKNSFTDFITCANHLINEGYTSPDRLCILGVSAGGLLVGAVTNMRPDLFKAVVARVPFVDVINTMFDPSIPLTVTEYDEWGNPNDKECYDYMKSYSPYDNVSKQKYPRMLLTAGLNDPRVQYWEPAKWTAKLRALKADSNLLLLKTNMGEGHSGKSGRYDAMKEAAFYYAFILDSVGLKQ